MAVNNQFRNGVREHHLFLMSDNGSQPTSMSFIKACWEMEIGQAFTSYNNPKGNADTERVFRTVKEELLWLRDLSSSMEAAARFFRLPKWLNSFCAVTIADSFLIPHPRFFNLARGSPTMHFLASARLMLLY